MKKRTIRGLALGLAVTSIIAAMSGDSTKEDSISKPASIVSENYDDYQTENYDIYYGHKEKTDDCRKIDIEDVVVIDTSKDSDDATVTEREEKYYVLMPLEASKNMTTSKSSATYYETCDHNALGAISFELGYVTIENSANTLFHVYRPDGELECVSSLKDILQEIGLDDCIQEAYTPADLQILNDRLNEKQKVLSFK